MATDKNQKLYFDHMANTPPDPRVVAAMVKNIEECFGNPLNLHDFGRKTSQIIDEARQKVADLIGADSKEIIFTSCGSESNNFALKGLAEAYKHKGKHIITSKIEHFSSLYMLKTLEKQGFKVTYLPVAQDGYLDPTIVAAAITNETSLVSLTQASNEIGTLEPIAEIGKIVKEKNIIFHVDAVQTAGVIPVNVANLKADALTLAANQFYGPTGVAALYVKQGTRMLPFIVGGSQEEGKRAGTQNIAGIVGMGKAAELAKAEMRGRNEKLVKLRDKLIDELTKTIDELYITGHPQKRLPGHVSCVIKYIEGESMSMLLNMEGIAVSTGSACVSKALKASHVVTALGVLPEDAHGSLVLSMGKENTEAEVKYVLKKLPPIVARLREMSPLCNKSPKS